MDIGYIVALVFFVIWFIFKVIEVTKERNSKKDADDQKKDQR